MFCIVSLRCSSEGPSLRRDPAKAVGRLPQLPTFRQLAPKAPGGAGSRACAATRLGAAGVAGGNRTDLGDQSVGGIGAFESKTGTHSRAIVLAGDSDQTVPELGPFGTALAHPPSPSRPPSRSPQEGCVIRDENEAAIGFPDAAGHCPRLRQRKARSCWIARAAMKVFVAELPERSTDAAGVDRYGCGIHAADQFPNRAKQTENDGARTAMTWLPDVRADTRIRRRKPPGFPSGSNGSRPLLQRENTDSPRAFRLTMAEMPITRPPMPPRRLSKTVESMAFFVMP